MKDIFQIRFSFQTKKQITQSWISFFVFLFEMGYIKIYFERWVQKIELNLL